MEARSHAMFFAHWGPLPFLLLPRKHVGSVLTKKHIADQPRDTGNMTSGGILRMHMFFG